MHHSSPSWPSHSKQNLTYFNPIAKIRTLIQNLDAELMQLCKQCTLPPKITPSLKHVPSKRHVAPNSSYTLGSPSKSVASVSNLNSYHPRVSTTKMAAASNDPSGGVHVRTLASVYRAKVIDAYRNRRIFTVYGNYHTIRRALLRRGWLEKLAPGRYPKLHMLSEDVLLAHAKRGNDYEAVAISKIINHFPAFFIWQPKILRDAWADVRPMRNRVRRDRTLDFSTKVGLIGCTEQEQWYRQDGVSGMNYPRFYRLSGIEEDRNAFIKDHRQTQCRSVLKFIIENCERDPEEICDETEGTIDMKVMHFAHRHVKKQLADFDHNDLDEDNHAWDNNVEKTEIENNEWKQFMITSKSLLNKSCKLKSKLKDLQDLVPQWKSTVEKVEERRPDFKWDGYRNLWILKPGYRSRGNGIIIRSSIDDILQWSTSYNKERYICQKYLERPLLIYKTKFDIRQYMLLTIGESTLCIWLYKDCYLRFSSQEFSIEDLRESIHLTNNSVQKKYKNKPTRDQRLPKNNMWTLDQFKAYLEFIKAPEQTWATKVFHGFRENLIAVVLASLEETLFVENAFELYGCDFMLDESYNPILIEINSTPDLSPSTEVTAHICPNALRDLVRVIVDLPRNPRALTGLFDLAYEVNYKIRNDTDAMKTLEVDGKQMKLCKQTRTPFRPKIFRRIIKADKKKAADSVRTTTSPRTVKKTKKSTQLEKTPTPTSTPSPTGKVALQSEMPIIKAETLPLKSATKQALALRYTKPK